MWIAESLSGTACQQKEKGDCVTMNTFPSSSGVTRNRTGDTRIFSPLLYQLSYDTICAELRVQRYAFFREFQTFQYFFPRNRAKTEIVWWLYTIFAWRRADLLYIQNEKTMIELGRYNRLRIVKEVDFGLYLDGGDDGEILLPKRYVPQEAKLGDELEVFLYLDSEERLVATTQQPLVQVGEFACLEVAWVNQYGAFLNWGLMKDLFVPFSEQKMKMEVGKRYMIHVHLDEESFRIVASAKVERYLSKEKADYLPGQEVEIVVWQKTDLGFKAIIDNRYAGLLYEGEIFQSLQIGVKRKAYVKQVREDGKIDLMLQRPGMDKVTDLSQILLAYIRQHGGFIPLGDKSPAEDIYATFGVSKKTFKKAVGDLYKKRLVVLEPEGIRLIES